MKRLLSTSVFLLLFVPSLIAQSFSPTNASSVSGFGGAVAIDDQHIFVGDSPIGWPSGQQPGGMVYMFEKDGKGEWVEANQFAAPDSQTGDNFGRSIYLDEGTLVVGAPGLGMAYVYERDENGNWLDAGNLVPTAMEDGAEFGGAFKRGGFRSNTIAISNSIIAVTAVHPESKNGSVHLFEKAGMEWRQVIKLDGGNVEKSSFGWSIGALSDGFVVGAPAMDDSGNLIVYKEENDTWQSVQYLSLEGEDLPKGIKNIGQTVSVVGDKIYTTVSWPGEFAVVLGFDGSNLEAGDVEIIKVEGEKDGSRWTRGFGAGLAASGTDLFVGARGSAVMNFSKDGDSWKTQKILPKDERSTPGFGVGLAIHGNTAVIGSPNSDYESGLATVYNRNPKTGEWSAGTSLFSEANYLDSITGEDKIECEEGKADQFDCDNVDLLSFMSAEELTSERGVRMTDIWGWEDPETGKEYVLQARTNGSAFVDISDPANPVYVGQLMKTASSPGSTWRDIKVYKNHAFVVADGARDHGVQIFDLTQLRDVDPADMPVDFEVTAHYTGVHSTHNIVINEETGFAYAVGNRAGGETCGGQLHMINVQDPVNPTFAGCYSLKDAGGTHDSQCVVYHGPDTKYQGREICINSNGSSLIIADVTDKENPVTVSHSFYPKTAYTHQGWLTEDHRHFYMNDELDEMNAMVDQTRTLIWDFQELEDPQLVNEFLLDSKASDHNLYVKDNFMYQSNYQAGLRILDISDPVNPVEAGHFDTVPYGEDQAGFGGSWSNYPYFKSGVIAISSRSEGLFLVKKKEVDS